MTQQSKRLEYIDFFRGIGIILMIMGHIGFGHVFDKWIHSFHMPMFFFVSGVFYSKDRPVVLNLKKNAKKMLLPYLFWGTFHYIIWMVFNHFNSSGVWYEPLKSLIWDNSKGLPIAGALWFLTAIFLTNSIYGILVHALREEAMLHLVVVLLAVWGCVAIKILPFQLPWSLNAAFVGVGFFHMAQMVSVKMKDALEKKLRIRTVIIAAIVFLLSSIFSLINGTINMREGSYAVIFLFWIIALGITLSGIIICRQFEILFNKWFMFSVISKIGKNSMAYLCLNQLFIMIFIKITRIMSLPHIVSAFLILLMTTVSIYSIDYIVRKTKLKIIFGQ